MTNTALCYRKFGQMSSHLVSSDIYVAKGVSRPGIAAAGVRNKIGKSDPTNICAEESLS